MRKFGCKNEQNNLKNSFRSLKLIKQQKNLKVLILMALPGVIRINQFIMVKKMDD